MEFRLLGPVEASTGDQLLDIGHARQRAVLAVLLLEAGRLVAADRVIDRVWGEDPPASVRNVLSGHIARLRVALAGAGAEDVALTWRSGGYLLKVDPGHVDVFRFRRLAADAVAASDRRQSATMLGEAIAVSNLALIDARLDRYQQAADGYAEALALSRQVGDRRHEAVTLSNLGNLERRQSHYRQAADWLRQALDINRETGAPAREADVRIDLGATLLAAGDLAEAQDEYTAALAVARQIGHTRYQGCAHDGLGNCEHASGDVNRAREHWQQALVLFTEIGAPEAGEVQDRLDGLCGPA